MPNDILYYISSHWLFIRVPKNALSWQSWYTFSFAELHAHEFNTCTCAFSTVEETKSCIFTRCAKPCKLHKGDNGSVLIGSVRFRVRREDSNSIITCKPLSAHLLQDKLVEVGYEFLKDNSLLDPLAMTEQTFD